MNKIAPMSATESTVIIRPESEREGSGIFRSDRSAHLNIVRSSKYTALNFVPLNLWHQMSKYSTVFFFVTLILQCIPAISPFSPIPYLLAFSIVIGVSMVKDALEDYKKHVNDTEINLRECLVLDKEGCMQTRAVMDLEPGDFIVVRKHEEVSADAILLRSVKHKKCLSYCFIDTANLDGESNLKKRVSPLNGDFSCPGPGPEQEGAEDLDVPDVNPPCECFKRARESLKSFTMRDTADSTQDCYCTLEMLNTSEDSAEYVANEKNTLLRGSVLRNTEIALCLVIAVGENTKQGKDCLRTRKNKSLFEEKMDHILFIIAGIYALMLITTTIMGAYMCYNNPNIIYINNGQKLRKVFKLVFSNYILYSYLIPLSLYVMIEVLRFFHGLYIKYDRKMKVDNVKSICRNSNVIEDLGIIDYVLTDKTGTITKNSMTLKHFHIRNCTTLSKKEDAFRDYQTSIASAIKSISSGLSDKQEMRARTVSGASCDADSSEKHCIEHSFNLLLLNLLLCNSVEVLSGKYEGISQDELCFLESIKEHGWSILEKEEDAIHVLCGKDSHIISVQHVVDFTSKRQNMSIIVELNGEYVLFCKGSDQRLVGKKSGYDDIRRILNNAGDYRSLVMCYKKLTKAEFEEIQESKSLGNGRSTKETLELIDRHIDEASYLGSTFIEDELQDEVETTVGMLREAGIKVWMITGDKRETAISCGKNSGIIKEGCIFREIEGKRALVELETALENRRAGRQRVSPQQRRITNEINAVVQEGPGENPAHANVTPEPLDRDWDLFACDNVIVYRTTPSQKGKIATLMAQNKKHVLAIGDGNNDVVMLKDAHVGVGIIGKEGTQASFAADFAIPQFKVLQNLIFIHGRYNLMRYSKVAINSYYKNLVFIFIQYFYNFYNGASGRPIYSPFFLNYYNLFFTSLIPFSIGLFDRNMPASRILQNPKLFKNARAYFCRAFILANIGFAIIESAFIYFSLYSFTRLDIASSTGKLGGYMCISTLYSIIIFITVIIRQVKLVEYVISYTYAAVILSVFFNLIMLFCLQEISADINLTIYHLLGMPVTYVILVGVIALVYVLDSLFDVVCNFIITNDCKKYSTTQ